MKIEIDYTDLWSEYVTKYRDKEYPGLDALTITINFPGEKITMYQSDPSYPLVNRTDLRVDREVIQ